jgi:hypothetical protein
VLSIEENVDSTIFLKNALSVNLFLELSSAAEALDLVVIVTVNVSCHLHAGKEGKMRNKDVK